MLANDVEGVREAIVEALAAIGAGTADVVVPAMLDADSTVSSWALLTLRRMGMGKACGAIAAMFDKATPEVQERLTRRLADISKQSWEDVIALLDGCLRRDASGQALAQRVLEVVDRDRLERECVGLWTTSRSASARFVLIRIFDYDAAALK